MIRPALAAIAGVALGYLIHVFYFVSFDISKWNEEGRFLGVMMMLAFGFLAGVWTHLFVRERDNG